MKPSKVCVICGVEFVKKPKQTWEVWGRKVACSQSCAGRARTLVPLRQRIEAKLEKRESCWIWTGARTPKGAYGVIARGRPSTSLVLTHRAMYEMCVGPIPTDYEVDHLCQVTLCCNPAHLEAVTKAENLRRQQEAITHCKRGHELTEENIYRPPGAPTKRNCRACIKTRTVKGKELA